MTFVRVAPLVVTALALGVVAVLRSRLERRDGHARVWASNTDALPGVHPGGAR